MKLKYWRWASLIILIASIIFHTLTFIIYMMKSDIFATTVCTPFPPVPGLPLYPYATVEGLSERVRVSFPPPDLNTRPPFNCSIVWPHSYGPYTVSNPEYLISLDMYVALWLFVGAFFLNHPERPPSNHLGVGAGIEKYDGERCSLYVGEQQLGRGVVMVFLHPNWQSSYLRHVDDTGSRSTTLEFRGGVLLGMSRDGVQMPLPSPLPEVRLTWNEWDNRVPCC